MILEVNMWVIHVNAIVDNTLLAKRPILHPGVSQKEVVICHAGLLHIIWNEASIRKFKREFDHED
jgi:hypothetical protein